MKQTNKQTIRFCALFFQLDRFAPNLENF